MKHVIAAEFVVEFIDANNSDATAGGPRNERLGARGNRSFGQVALAPAFVARFPQVQDGLVATHYGKPPVVMQHLETESVAIESDGGGRISNRHGRDRLVEPDAGSQQIGRLIRCLWTERHVEARRIPPLEALDQLFRSLYD